MPLQFLLIIISMLTVVHTGHVNSGVRARDLSMFQTAITGLTNDKVTTCVWDLYEPVSLF